MKKIDLIIISYNRLKDLQDTIKNVLKYKNQINKIIIVDNASIDGTSNFLKTLNDKKFEIILNKKNLGVAGGRNLGIQKSNADILVFIDDDAVFNINKINPFEVIENNFKNDDRLGIIAFKITNYYTKKVLKYEFPFINKDINENRKNLCAYYIGAGHAIKRDVFEKCGLYPEDYFYGFEELDLSLRAINNGFKIFYDPEIEIFHKQSPTGRQKNDEKWAQVYRNRLIISYKYYPFKYRLITNFLWFFKIAFISKSFKVPLNGYKRYLSIRNSLKKKIISKETLEYLKKYSGRLYY
jgi:GT2 family glycosyltransferase